MSKPTIQVVAFRRETNSDSIYNTKPYYLDIQDAPNIAINYNFEDVKNPETRKTDFSQTFKLPMSDVNNQFFEHWYNVNIDKLIYSQNDLIEAQIIVNGQPVLTGNLKLQGVYKKAGYYDVAILGKIATLFTAVGTKTVREAFTTQDETDPTVFTDDDDFKHLWGVGNVENSWTGDGSVAFNNTSGVSLRDTVASVNKVIYPITESINFRCEWDSADDNDWLNNQTDMDDAQGGDRNWVYYLPPALQLRSILDKIFAKAGFRWSSTFLDSVYFRRIFMSTMDHDETTNRLPASDLPAVFNGNAYMIAPTTAEATSAPLIIGVDDWVFMDTGEDTLATTSFSGPAVDSGEVTYNPSFPDLYEFTPNVSGYYQITITSYIEHVNIGDGSATGQIAFGFHNGVWPQQPYALQDYEFNGFTDQFLQLTTTVYLTAGDEYRPFMGIVSDSGFAYPIIELGGNTLINGHRYEIMVLPEQLGVQINGATINPPGGIDPELKQSDFLKDIIQRFNLIVSADKEDPSLLYIEPFDDFVGTGEVKNWDNKIDDEKEILLKPTSDLIKKGVHFHDKESEDKLNKIVKEEMPNSNVWGHYKQNFSNVFAKEGMFENKPVLAPYLVNKPMTSWNSGVYDAQMNNFVFNSQASYSENGNIKIQKSPHKLFYYNGMPTTLDEPIYMNNYYFVLEQVYLQVIEYTTYPLCTAYELDNANWGSTNDFSTMRSLFWDYNRNDWINSSTMFNGYMGDIPKALYETYWKRYIQEMYSEDSRLLELNVFLTPLDIANFDFRDIIYLKGTYWRVVKLSNYQVGTTTSTKITLLKSPDLNGMVCWSDLCDNLEYQILVGGSAFGADYFIQIADGSGGFTPLMSPECCECFGGTPLGDLNPTFCLVYGEYIDPNNETVTNTDDPLVPEGMPGQPTGSGQAGIMSMGTNLIGGGAVDVKKIKVLTKANSFSPNKTYKFVDKNGTIRDITKPKTPQLNYQRNDFDVVGNTTSAIGYINVGGSKKPIIIRGETITYVNAKITCIVIDGAVDTGKSATFNIDTAFTISEGLITKVGAGNITTTIQSNLTTLSFAFALECQSVSSGRPQMIIKVVTSNADSYTKVQWAGQMSVNTMDILSSTISVAETFLALYESAPTITDNILLEDNNKLAWN